MKKVLLLLTTIMCTVFANAQNFLDYDSVKLEKTEDYHIGDSIALEAANTLLLNPINKGEITRLKCQKFLLKWMSGTPDFSFTFGKKFKIIDGDLGLTGIYLASMVKFALENRELAKDQNKMEYGTWRILLAYCDIPENNVKVTKKIQKLIEANKNGELEKNL